MEELISKAQQLCVSQQACYGSRIAMYKQAHRTLSQEERRQKFLKSLKESRYDYLSHIRKLTEPSPEDQDDSAEEDEQMEVVAPPKTWSSNYKKQIMLSEWMVEVPQDLEDRWLMVPCPVGTRCLVIASKFKTTAYYRNGKMLAQFVSHLPGGNGNAVRGVTTILDCFATPQRKFYILDVMCWNNHPFYNSEKEFRTFMLESKCSEGDPLTQTSKSHRYPFHLLPHYSCSKAALQSFLHQDLPFPEKLDGLLFFHKEGHYILGVTPLCAWLKAYMVPEMLGLDVPAHLTEDRPIDYEDMRSALPSKVYDKAQKRKEIKESQMQME